MCVMAFALGVSSQWRLVLAANRDELHDRPTDPLGWWPDAPQVCGGRDRMAGGTWMGLSRGGRFAALTNLRDPASPVPSDAASRGGLVAQFVMADRPTSDFAEAAESADPADATDSAAAYARKVASRLDRYAGFNLVVGDLSMRSAWWFVGSTVAQPRRVERGVHGLSNGSLDTDWPKVRRLRQAVHEAAAGGGAHRLYDDEPLFEQLRCTAVPPDEHLPDTGVGVERERLLAPLYVRAPGYGTRCSTVLRVAHDGRVRVVERTWPLQVDGGGFIERAIEFRLD